MAEQPSPTSDPVDRDLAADEAAMQALARLAAYEKVVRRQENRCPPLFNLTGIEVLFAGRKLEELIRRPFIGRCAVREKGAPISVEQ